MNGKIVDYRILAFESESELAAEVRLLISQGWEPQGGVAYAASTLGISSEEFVQAMVLRGDG